MVALPAEALAFFSPREYAIFHAVAETVIHTGKGPTIDQVGVTLRADRFLARVDEDAQRDFHRLLALFDNALAGLFLCGTTAPFTQMSPEARHAFLQKWQRHRLGVIRTGFDALKRLAASSYYGDPSTHGALGYPGPPEKDPE